MNRPPNPDALPRELIGWVVEQRTDRTYWIGPYDEDLARSWATDEFSTGRICPAYRTYGPPETVRRANR